VLEELEKISGNYRDLESKPKGADKKVRRAWKRLKWEPEDIRDLRSRISSNISLLNALNARIAREHTSKLVQTQERQENHALLDWLTPVDFAVQQSDIISRRQEGTGIWFRDSPEFHGWVHGVNQTLFCPGIPGAGKTMIAAIAVDHLWKHVQNQTTGVAFIYCNYKSQTDQAAANLASAILKQLIQGLILIPEPVAQLYKRHAERRTRPLFEEIQDAIKIVVFNYSKVYVIIDALDECLKDHRMQLVSMLRSLQSNGNLNLMATSRFIPDVEKHFSCSPLLEVRANDFDVKQFVVGQMSRLPACVQRDGELQETIQNGISMAVEGM
jgi:Cdc6-like AAA superfamily ATPase